MPPALMLQCMRGFELMEEVGLQGLLLQGKWRIYMPTMFVFLAPAFTAPVGWWIVQCPPDNLHA